MGTDPHNNKLGREAGNEMNMSNEEIEVLEQQIVGIESWIDSLQGQISDARYEITLKRERIAELGGTE